jgi:type VII secretion-associated serine protease mycosin
VTRPRTPLAAIGCALVALLSTAPPAFADNIRSGQWFLTTLRIAEAQALSTGEGVTIAVVDSGVDGRHVDLTSNVLAGVDLTNSDGGDGWADQDGHGTGVASIIAGHGHGSGDGALGIAPTAKILPVRRKATSNLDQGQVAHGIEWAADHGARVVNLSIGGGDITTLRQAVGYALGHDVVVVAAVGPPGGLGRVPAIARIPGLVAVSGVNQAGNIVASASGPEVAIAAPAKDIPHATKNGGYGLATGTSAATAIVSGVVALIRAKYPDLDAANVINRLIQTADDKGPPGRDQEYGFGIVNPVRALTADVPRVDRNPLLTSVEQSSPPVPLTRSPAQPSAAPSDSGPPWIWFGIGLAVVVIAGVTALLVGSGRRRSLAERDA